MSDDEKNTEYGQLLKSAVRKIRDLQSRLDKLKQAQQQPIAIIGIGCRLPGSVSGPSEYWRLLQEGRDAIREVPASRWDVDAYYDADPESPGKICFREGGFLDDVAGFDADFFGITPREAITIDPQQRLILETSWEALERAGLAVDRLSGTSTGVFIGVTTPEYRELLSRRGPDHIDAYVSTGNGPCFVAGRVAYLLGLRGPCLAVDTACSSSLVAVHLARRSLLGGECDVALAGGVHVIASPERSINLTKAKMLSPDGRCKTFDARANGYGRAEGAGVVVLKRLIDARRDGDPILAVIEGSAINQDGRSSSLTAPNGPAQEQLLRAALSSAGVTAAEIDYVEAHGTGTPLGDPIEVNALNAIYGTDRPRQQPVLIGSVKTNIGHLEAAAGIAGLIKVVLALQHQLIPAQLHFHEPNPHIAWDDMRLEVATENVPWLTGRPRRRAGVSSFGFSGTNAHVILAEAPQPTNDQPPDQTASDRDRPAHVLTLSARSAPALRELAARYADCLADEPGIDIGDVGFSANSGRAHFAHRWCAIVESPEAACEVLREMAAGGSGAAQGGEGGGNATQRAACFRGEAAAGQPPRIAFLFAGQGGQYRGMGRLLYETQPTFRRTLERCDEILRPTLDLSLLDVLFADNGKSSPLDQTAYTQPALFALEYALAELWKSWGVEPVMVLGHSVGEYVAACVAGVFSLEDGLRLIAERARLMQALPQGGAMAAVVADEARVNTAIRPYDAQVAIAAINGPRQVVISGSRAAVDAVTAELQSEGIDSQRLNVSHAFHSPLVEPMLSRFEQTCRTVNYSNPRLEMISNLSGQPVNGEVARPEYWRDHVRQPVLFFAGMTSLDRKRVDAFLELGPQATLIGLGRQCIDRNGGPPPLWLPSLRPDRDDWRQLLESLSQLYVRGAPIDWRAFDRDYCRRRVTLPTYPFQRRQFWVADGDAPATETDAVTPVSNWVPSPAGLQIDERWLTGLEDEIQQLSPRLSEIGVRFMIQAIGQMIGRWEVGTGFSSTVLKERLPAKNHAKLDRIIGQLIKLGFVHQVGDEYWLQKPAPPRTGDQLLEVLRRDHPCFEVELVQRCGRQLVAVLRDEIDVLSMFFPEGSTREAEEFYTNSPLFRGYNQLAARLVHQVAGQLPADRRLRVLEIGAGTGGLTAHLLGQLPAGRTEYVFTDVSPLFLSVARQRFNAFPFLQTGILDISQPPGEQGFEAGSFDLVLAANVLHATPDLRASLMHVQQLLTEGGWLVLLEETNPQLWGDMVFSLIDGWWLFEDKDLRPEYPLMPPDRWREVLQAVGYRDILSLTDRQAKEKSLHTLFIAQAGSRCTRQPGRAGHEPWRAPAAAAPATAPTAAIGRQKATPRGTDLQWLGPDQRRVELENIVCAHLARVVHLAPDTVDRKRSIFDLGMDSLMAIEFRSLLQREVGIELPMTVLMRRPSILDVAAYINEKMTLEGIERPFGATDVSRTPISDAAGAPAPATVQPHLASKILVRLQPAGSQPPLFFVPAGYGDLLAFHDIARNLGSDQPVYGLQPPGREHAKAAGHISIYRLVSTYITEMRKVQAAGPYRLAGYSAGGIIAVELARELLRMGETISLLVLFDPPDRIPSWLDALYNGILVLCKQTRMLGLVRRFQNRRLRRMFHAVLDEGLRTHNAVTRGHRITPYPGRITYFRARGSFVPYLTPFTRTDKFWRAVAEEGIEVHWIPGSHYGMVRGPHAEVLVEELRDCLKRSRH